MTLVLQARVRHRLGFSLWASGELEEAKEQLQAALTVLESGSEKHRDRKTAALYTSTQHALQRVLVGEFTSPFVEYDFFEHNAHLAFSQDFTYQFPQLS